MKTSTTQPHSNVCELCAELRTERIHGNAGEHAPLANRLVARSENFVAFPSVSPLRLGHLLIVPARHVTASAHLEPESRQELVEFARTMAGAISTSGEVACFEHGVARGQAGGCGIDHAHLHLVPMTEGERAHCRRLIEAEFPLREHADLSGALGSLPADATYVYFGRVDLVHLTTAPFVPSQFLRRCAARSIGNPVEDWRSLADWEVLEATHAELVR